MTFVTQQCATAQFTGAAHESDVPRLVPVSRKRGTKRPKKLHFYTVGLTQEEWDWLEKWLEADVEARTRTDLLRELFARAMLFWPDGVNTRPLRVKPRRRQLPHAAITKYADAHGISKEDALILAWNEFIQKRGMQSNELVP